ncbi:class II lanthipeptide, LchA2/BrtA2 family [Microbispora rosea]|uniref:class II lanthipeptide, LchA2/BrtA2 family n=1 Tax=Microbispora rosea TaxID=58117 RepID=UPI00343C5449
MGNMLTTRSTGFVPEDELIQLAEPPQELSVGDAAPNSTALACGISAVTLSVTTLSLAMGDNCPSTACTSRC